MSEVPEAEGASPEPMMEVASAKGQDAIYAAGLLRNQALVTFKRVGAG